MLLNPNNNLVKTYYDYDNDSSKLFEEFYQINGKREGKCTKYYYNYEIDKEVCNFKDDKKEGEYISYFKNGKIAMVCNFSNDNLEGKCIYYFQNGTISMFCNYFNGTIVGEIIKFDENGNLKKLF